MAFYSLHLVGQIRSDNSDSRWITSGMLSLEGSIFKIWLECLSLDVCSIKLGGVLFSGQVCVPKQCGVGPGVQMCSQSSILVCPVVSVSVSSQLPVLLQCLLPPHVKSGECSTSKHHNLPAWGSSQQPHPGSSPQTLRATAFCLCVRVCYIVHCFEKCARIVCINMDQLI